MVAHLIKFVLFILFLSLSLSVSGAEVTMGDKVLSIAAREVIKTTAALGNIIEVCKSREKKLNINDLKFPNINERDTLIALVYLSGKATDKCEGDAWARFSHSLGNYNNVVKYYEIKGKQEFEYEVLTNDVWRKLKLEVEYLELNEDDKKIFESNKELKSSFDAMYLFKELEKTGKFSKSRSE